MLLELSILTQVPTIACIVIALCGHHTVQASLSAIVRYVVVLEISFLIGFWSTVAWLDFVTFGSLTLTLEVNVFPDEGEELETFPEPFETSGIVFEHLDDIGVFYFFDFLAVILSLGDDGWGLDLDFAFLHESIYKNGSNVNFIMRPD